MTKVNIAIIHGIGINKVGYSAPLVAGIKKEFDAILKKEFSDQQDRLDQIEVVEIVWDDILDDHQRLLGERLKAAFEALGPKNFFEKIIGTIFFLPKKGINFLRTDFAAQYVCDVIAYRNELVYQKVQERISNEIKKFVEATPNAKNNITFITHSLGTVMASDFIYDRQKFSGEFYAGLQLNDFFTMGSPIALFALRYGLEAFQSPIHMENPQGRWLNIFDRDDPISYPLKFLNDAYSKAVDKDVEVNTGIFGVAHVRYWDSLQVFRIIAQRLAERWLKMNPG